MTIKQLTYDDITITPSDVFVQMGYGEAVPDDATQRETQKLCDEVQRWLEPQFCYRVVTELSEGFRMGTIIERQLRDAEAYALFIATAGRAYENYLQQLKDKGDMVRTFIADALGSVIAEHCADRMEEHVQETIDKLHWHHTNRFSPGYCGWDVAQQQLLFPLFGGQTCGVTLSDSSLMLPIKSVSGIIGLGAVVRKLEYSCGLCTMQQCYKRKRQ